ncbi:hypothetical protein [Rubripirellula lacrimiformis]|uniref:hypothetical protein n=1 Tax=Rubripirellula lacrimiformis TaxID=1930273 RepID=UPI0011A78E61|nr:hypothetical protein [Rubripirellula lacrimiformis]
MAIEFAVACGDESFAGTAQVVFPAPELQQDDRELAVHLVVAMACDATRRSRNSGGTTWWSAAHWIFSVSLWQQHRSQQNSAEAQPQGQS